MARRQSVFTGTMKFGILTIPVKLYKPHFDEEKVPSSHMEHNCGCGKPIQRPWHCPACNKGVDYSTLVKVFENGTELTQQQVQSAKIPDKEFTISEFVRAEDLDPMNLDGDVYFIEVDGYEALEAYSVLSVTLRQTDRVGIAYWASRGTDKMVVVRPYRDGLVCQVLKCGNLVDSPDFGTNLGSEVLEMAQMMSKIVEKKTVDFDPSKYQSTYVTNMRAMINGEVAFSVLETKPKTSALAEMLSVMEEAA